MKITKQTIDEINDIVLALYLIETNRTWLNNFIDRGFSLYTNGIDSNQLTMSNQESREYLDMLEIKYKNRLEELNVELI